MSRNPRYLKNTKRENYERDGYTSIAAEPAKQSYNDDNDDTADHRHAQIYASDRSTSDDMLQNKAEGVPTNVPESLSAQQEVDESNGHKALCQGQDSGSGISVNPKYAGFDCMWTCDGPYMTTKTSYREVYFCRACNNIGFCESCITWVKNDQMPYRCCAKDHPFVRVFPLTEEAKRMANALVEGRFEVQQECLEGLRKAWDC